MIRYLYPLFLIGLFVTTLSAQDVKKLPDVYSTPWTQSAICDSPLPEYPRPALQRSLWKSLNGMWDYAIVSKSEDTTISAMGQIRVPFSIESPLSDVGKQVGPENKLIYRHNFEVPADWTGSKILLNFEAVDWKAEILVNGKSVGHHQGGYVPFSIDITEALNDSGLQLLEVQVYDPTDASWQPRGWQKRQTEDGGSPVTGIWGSVWIEPVSNKAFISDMWTVSGVKQKDVLTPSLDGAVFVSGSVTRISEAEVRIQAYNDANELIATVETPVQEFGYFGAQLVIPTPQLWSPENPYLYRLVVEVLSENEVVDTVESYCGIRTVGLVKDENGVSRVGLNGKPIFLLGVRRDGWFPDGGYTAPSDQALQYELEAAKRMGFNWIYQHRKVESRRFYYWCDKIGLLVWQEMPGGGDSIQPGEKDIVRTDQAQQNFYIEWGEIIETLRNSPSIMAWVPFGEGYGQSETEQTIEWTKSHDSTRLVDGPSGWEDRGVGDVLDLHFLKATSEKAKSIGEPGGVSPQNEFGSKSEKKEELEDGKTMASRGALVPGNIRNSASDVVENKSDKNFASRFSPQASPNRAVVMSKYEIKKDATKNEILVSNLSPSVSDYESFIETIKPLIDKGLSGAAYYPYTSGDLKFFGILSFDRKTNNFGEETIRQLNEQIKKMGN